MRKFILAFLIMTAILAPTTQSFGNYSVTIKAGKLPRKVQQSYDVTIASFTQTLYGFGGLPLVFLESTTRNSDGNFVFTLSIFDMSGVIPDQYSTMEISPRGEVIGWPVFYIQG